MLLSADVIDGDVAMWVGDLDAGDGDLVVCGGDPDV
jgi:hypothetical protein